MKMKSNKAITLVALIITIIVLLILAGVTLNMVLGENGLINKAQSSVDKYQQSANNEQILLNSIEQYIDLKTETGVTVTPTQIANDSTTYYGAKVTNYTAGGATWRIFYVDTDDGPDGNGKYGDGKNTVYLIAEYDDNRKQTLGTYSNGTYTANAYQSGTTKIREMNPTWKKYRNSVAESDWRENEKAAAYLCDTSKWTTYYDSAKANYAIGGPSLEMYADSYNKTHNSNSLIYTCTPTTETSSTNYGNGYFVGANGTYSNSGYYTNSNTIDTSQNGIYMVSDKYFWLASPSAYYTGNVSYVRGINANVSSSSLNDTNGVRPLVSLQSDFQIKIEV